MLAFHKIYSNYFSIYTVGTTQYLILHVGTFYYVYGKFILAYSLVRYNIRLFERLYTLCVIGSDFRRVK